MAHKLPAPLAALLTAASPEARERAWKELVEEYSKLILHAARNGSSSYDETMDRYTHVLDRLRSEDFRRLRSYSSDGASQFTTWLFVVARRLSIDHHRRTFGRISPDPEPGSAQADEQAARKRLARLLAEELDPDTLRDAGGEDPETSVWLAERNGALEEVLQSLEPADRLLLTLRFVDDLPVRKIAVVMPFRSPFQVYRRLKKVLETLRRGLRQRGISGP